MIFRVEVRKRGENKEGHALLSEICQSTRGTKKLLGIEVIRLYFISGALKREILKSLTEKIFGDEVNCQVKVGRFPVKGVSIEILYNPGVSDPQEDSIQKTFADFGLADVKIRTGKRYIFKGNLKGKEVRKIAEEFLYNPLIQHIAKPKERVFTSGQEYIFKLEEIPIRSLTIKDLAEISKMRLLALSVAEMRAIQRYYQKLGREPTDIELETFAQTWSEHCKHKTLRGDVLFTDDKGEEKRISDLLGSTIFKVTEELKRPFCLSVFKDNSGVIELDGDYGVTFKVETHNHPSALEPYGGAATGIGGVIRDCLGTGKGAKPILNTDVFCFAPPDFPKKNLPKGVLPPKRVLFGVVSGVRDYGNRMGIPTANGALYFHPTFLGNPLVFCGTLGLIPRDKIKKEISPGDIICLCGAKTGRDGIHGVTFASLELSEDISSSVVQIGNPIEEKKLTDAVIEARDKGLINAITDCGGGGLSSAVGELCRDFGCEVHLEKVPLKYSGLSYTEIWISESQERMIIITAPEKVEKLIRLFNAYDCSCMVIGRVGNDQKLRLYYKERQVCELDMDFLHKGNPKIVRRARFRERDFPNPSLPEPKDYNKKLLSLLASYNIASKEWVVRQYDFEVQGRTCIKPISSDGCVLKPLYNKDYGVVVGCGINPRYGLLDAYWMAASAVDEALRNIVASGGDINHTALLDNFCFGNPKKPRVMGDILRACLGASETALGYQVPFISGKDSLYNEYKIKGKKTISIPPTLLISAVSVIPNLSLALTPGFKQEGSLIYIVGETKDELGGSEYLNLLGRLKGRVPKVDTKLGVEIFRRIFEANKIGLLLSCHDIAEGGIGVAIAEMCIWGKIGCEISLKEIPGADKIKRDDFLLFSESNTRFICEVKKGLEEEFEKLFSGLPHALIGKVKMNKENSLKITGRECQVFLPVAVLTDCWSNSLSKVLSASKGF